MLIRALLLSFAVAAIGGAVEVDSSASALRDQLVTAEQVIDQRFQAVGDEMPMTVVGASRGAYIEGYGVVFTVQVNIAPVGNINPFRRSYSGEEIGQINIRKRQRMETLEQRTRELLVELSGSITGLPANEKIAIAVSLFHFAWEDLTQLPKQMVMAAAKSVLAQAKNGALPLADLRSRLNIRYF
ncbi:MAG: hypothetical protein O3A53_19700 [Acidobacteria bacterium]|nr:hypothetical protein [Acidobacteriota bacterium]MDA1237008.1 hypothetical protein [Acidobacteriota bacterium]